MESPQQVSNPSIPTSLLPPTLPIPTISDLLPSLPPLSSSSFSLLSSSSSSSTTFPISSPITTRSATPTYGIFHFPPLKLVYFIPAIVVVGIIVLICMIWCIQGCCTRRRRKPHDDPELVGGLPYEVPEMDLEKGQHHRYPPVFDYPVGQHQSTYSGRIGSVHGNHYSLAHRRSSGSHTAANPLVSRFSSDSVVHNPGVEKGSTVTGERNWMDSLRAVAGSVFINQSEDQPNDIPPRRGVTLRDDGPVQRTSRPKAPTEEDWIEAGKKRRLKLSAISNGLAKHTGTTVKSLPSNTFRRSPSRANDENNAGHEPGAWSPQTAFKVIQESPITSPILHTAFATPQSDYRKTPYPPQHFNFQSDPRISFLPLSPPQIMTPPMEGELFFSSPPGTEPTLQGLANLITLPDKKGKSRRTPSRSSIELGTDGPLPDPRTREGSGVDVVWLDKPRHKLFKKRSTLMGFRYERLAGTSHNG